MKRTRYATSRQKVCLNCSTGKVKCDRNPEGCGSCAWRGLPCSYSQAVLTGRSTSDSASNSGTSLSSPMSSSNITSPRTLLPSLEREPPVGTGNQNPILNSTHPINAVSNTYTGARIPKNSRLDAGNPLSTVSEAPDFTGVDIFSGVEFCCPINSKDIQNRWLNSFVPIPGQKVKEYSASISAFIYRILQSYAAVTVRGRGVPPFVHASQVTATSTRPPLATCLTLVRICEKPLPGSESVAADVLEREMNSLYEQHATYDDMTLLGAFQAYLIYSMVLFFRLSQGSSPFLRQAMMNLQELACSSSCQGLVCTAEQQHARPRWEAWIVAEAKRRTLFTMYLFDSVLSSQDGLPTFLGTELQGLPASASQCLWRSQTRHEWEMAYNTHLTDWTEGGLRIDELWPIPPDLDASGVLERRSRVDRWLENVDEFGTVLYAVTSCTHGG